MRNIALITTMIVWSSTSYGERLLKCEDIKSIVEVVQENYVGRNNEHIKSTQLTDFALMGAAQNHFFSQLPNANLMVRLSEVELFRRLNTADIVDQVLNRGDCSVFSRALDRYEIGLQNLKKMISTADFENELLPEILDTEEDFFSGKLGANVHFSGPIGFAEDMDGIWDRLNYRIFEQHLQIADGLRIYQVRQDKDLIWSLVRDEYTRLAKPEYMVQLRAELPTMIIKAMMQSLDGHSQYLSESETVRFLDRLGEGEEDLGITTAKYGRGLMVLSLSEGGTARRQGRLKRGDIILQIDDVDLFNLDSSSAMSLLGGPAGSEVKLLVERPGEFAPLTMSVRRNASSDKPLVVTSELKIAEGKKIGVIYLSYFQKGVTKEVNFHMENLIAQGASVFVFDVRNNAGGRLDDVTELLSLLLGPGKCIVYQAPKLNCEERTEAIASVKAEMMSVPIMVLVNFKTASGAEIFAGNLEAYGRGIVIGSSETFGKGNEQTVFTLASKRRGRLDSPGAVKVTTSYFNLADGRSVQRLGIVPNIMLFSVHENLKSNESKEFPQSLPMNQPLLDVQEKHNSAYANVLSRRNRLVGELKEVFLTEIKPSLVSRSQSGERADFEGIASLSIAAKFAQIIENSSRIEARK